MNFNVYGLKRATTRQVIVTHGAAHTRAVIFFSAARMNGGNRCSQSAVNTPSAALRSPPVTKSNTSICCQDLLLWSNNSRSETSNLRDKIWVRGAGYTCDLSDQGVVLSPQRNFLLDRYFNDCPFGCTSRQMSRLDLGRI